MTSEPASALISPPNPPELVYEDAVWGARVYHGDCLQFLDNLAAQAPEGSVDMIFADPPYFLSNGGMTCRSGRRAKVDKGEWDKSRGADLNHQFNLEWLKRCQSVLKPNGSIWVTGTQHVIFSVGFAMQQLGFKLLNTIAWEKPNPPPNLSCRYFTHSTETVVWAARDTGSKHTFHYKLMRQLNGGRQMKAVWRIGAPRASEKTFGKHPTQKPVALLERCILASTNRGDLVLDPFAGSGTTAIAALKLGRRFIGVDLDLPSVELAARRLTHASKLDGLQGSELGDH